MQVDLRKMADSIIDYLKPLKIFSAKEFPAGSVWPNCKEPITMEQLKGNIVILDFWTYCCINCMHVLRELELIESRYKDKPVVIIGVHSAKFANEQSGKNIESAIERYGIEHPVIIDTDMKIWKAYGSQGWPTVVIVDPEGNIIYRQSGEGQVKSIGETVDKMLENHGTEKTLKPKFKFELIKREKHASTLSYPGKISFSPEGKELAISDSNNNRILIIDTKSREIKEIIGGSKGFEDGSFAKASFFRPQGVCWSDSSTVYIADTENHAIRQADLEKKTVATIAGTGSESQWLALGGNALKMALSSPWDLAYRDGILYVAMAGTHQIWKYDVNKKEIRPFAGSGFEGIEDGKGMGSLLAQPSGLWLMGDFLYFADSEASAVRRIELNTQKVETLVGTGLFDYGYRDGKFKDAQFQHPLGICADDSTVYVADTYNNMIRTLDLKSRSVQILVGGRDHYGMCKYDDPKCDVLGLYEPNDVKINDGKLYIADTNNHLIRIYDLREHILTTFEIKGTGK